MFDFVLKGANASQLEKDIGSDMFPANEHYFGLVNVSKSINILKLYMYIFLLQFNSVYSLLINIFSKFAVWEHMLLKFCATSLIFL